MTKYEYWEEKKSECLEKALQHKNDKNLVAFYTNAMLGFSWKMHNEPIEEACKSITH